MSNWRDIRPFKGKTDNQIKAMLKAHVGRPIFGPKGDEMVERAFEGMMRELSLFDTPYYTHIPSGDIARRPQTIGADVERAVEDLRACTMDYDTRKQPKITDSTDEWAKQHAVKPITALFNDKGKKCTHRITNTSSPRFSATIIESKEDYVRSRAVGLSGKPQDTRGFLAEEYILSYLNQFGVCPECNVRGAFASCGGSGDGETSGAFRDGVCLSCKEKGQDTLFEIKTRNEKAVQQQTYRNGNISVHAGSLVALVSLLAAGAKVYVILVSRDTGDIRVSKIQDIRPLATEDFCYNVECEDRIVGSPRSTVYVRPCQTLKMDPMDCWLTKETSLKVLEEAMKIVLDEI